MSHLLEFYGDECDHCQKMRVLTLRLEKEKGVTVDRIEIWHNEENLKKMEKYDKKLCGGVPFLFNTKNGKWVCGEAPYKKVLEWAKD